ncbi:unnamed protein product [Rangifer tarandus platyrhynchus]|uniref:Uncharacterized protein n=1 Tax=Rangifer tarandus platyrhynchus TaxID=3082113 RepID=A0AC59ZLH9_RANTA
MLTEQQENRKKPVRLAFLHCSVFHKNQLGDEFGGEFGSGPGRREYRGHQPEDLAPHGDREAQPELRVLLLQSRPPDPHRTP